MRWPKSLAGLLLMFAVVSGQAGAQETRNEVAGTIGRTFISDQTVPNTSFPNNTVHFGKSTPFEINYARELLRFHWGVLAAEVPTVISLDHDLNYGVNQIPKEYKSVFITPAARISFPSALPFAPGSVSVAALGIFRPAATWFFSGPILGLGSKLQAFCRGELAWILICPG